MERRARTIGVDAAPSSFAPLIEAPIGPSQAQGATQRGRKAASSDRNHDNLRTPQQEAGLIYSGEGKGRRKKRWEATASKGRQAIREDAYVEDMVGMCSVSFDAGRAGTRSRILSMVVVWVDEKRVSSPSAKILDGHEKDLARRNSNFGLVFFFPCDQA